MTIKIGDIKRIKRDQEYTCREVRGKLCVVESLPNGKGQTYHIRCVADTGDHIGQWAAAKHLEDI